MRMVVEVQRRRSGARMMTSSAPRIVVEKDQATTLATLRLSHGPVNSLGRPFVEELTKTLKELENDPQASADVCYFVLHTFVHLTFPPPGRSMASFSLLAAKMSSGMGTPHLWAMLT